MDNPIAIAARPIITTTPPTTPPTMAPVFELLFGVGEGVGITVDEEKPESDDADDVAPVRVRVPDAETVAPEGRIAPGARSGESRNRTWV